MYVEFVELAIEYPFFSSAVSQVSLKCSKPYVHGSKEMPLQKSDNYWLTKVLKQHGAIFIYSLGVSVKADAVHIQISAKLM